jgi:hypothetical protein
MDNIYQVVAQFDDGESISYILIGNFTNLEVANDCKEKWDSFFKHHQILLREFIKIDVNKLEINQEVFISNNMFYDPMVQLMTQWDRDWKIDKLNDR